MNKIIELNIKNHFAPEGCSCGTGYSEGDNCTVKLESGQEFEIYVDTWYCDDEMIANNFIRTIENLNKKLILSYIEPIDNKYEALQMFMEKYKNK